MWTSRETFLQVRADGDQIAVKPNTNIMTHHTPELCGTLL